MTIFGFIFTACVAAGACGPIGSDGTTSLAPEAAAPAPTTVTPMVDSGTDSGSPAESGANDSAASSDAPAEAIVASDAPAE